MKNLRTEAEVMANWEGSVNKPVVSICCITYNHKDYISEAIDSFLMQETDFPFEILIHDDASTDETTDIVLAYAKKYPKIIRTIIQTVNQYSQNIRCTMIAVNQVKAELISFCEGDDYWIDKCKLARQVEAMNSKPKVNICFHPAEVKYEGKDKENDRIRNYGDYGSKKKIIKCKEVILKGGGFMPMASIMIRRRMIDDIRKKDSLFLMQNMTHFFYQIMGAYQGGALYLPNNMSVYRSMHEGSWSYKASINSTFQLNAVEKFIESVVKANNITGARYEKEFHEVMRLRVRGCINTFSIPVVSRKNIFNKYGDLLKINDKLAWFCVLQYPSLHKSALFCKKILKQFILK